MNVKGKTIMIATPQSARSRRWLKTVENVKRANRANRPAKPRDLQSRNSSRCSLLVEYLRIKG